MAASNLQSVFFLQTGEQGTDRIGGGEGVFETFKNLCTIDQQ